MRKNIFTALSVVILLSKSQMVFSQQTTDGNFLFKMWFFIEHTNQKMRTENNFPVKDSSLYRLYEQNISLRLDTLRSEGFSDDYLFLSAAVLKNNIEHDDNAITYSKTRFLNYIGVPVSNCEGYVLCVNTNTGKSYRIQGFAGNDFLSLMQEIKREYLAKSNKTISARRILKTRKVTGMDLGCIYKGLLSASVDTKKYPCLKTCSDFVVKIH